MLSILTAHYSETRRAPVTRSTCNRWRIVCSWTVCTSAFCARAVRRRAHRTGGMVTSTWDRLFWCRPIAGSLIRVTRRPTNVWTSWRTRLACTAVIRSWTARRHVRRWVRWQFDAGLHIIFILFLRQGLNPGRAIAELKRLLSGLKTKDAPKLQTNALHQ